MQREERLKKIVKMLSSKESMSGSVLAQATGVTRQVIVQDIAILKSRGFDIVSTTRGYVLKSKSPNFVFLVAVNHTEKMIRKELECIVRNGGEVIDVVIHHPVYGEIKKDLGIKTFDDVEKFMAMLRASKATPLLSLSNGVHTHTIGTDTKENIAKIKTCLKELGILI